jgi:hypothetical protein
MSRVEQIGSARLYLADAAEIISELPAIELVITDPPFSSGARTDSERQVRGAMLRSMPPGRLRDRASQSRQIIRRIVVPAWFAELMGDGASNDNQQNGNASA